MYRVRYLSLFSKEFFFKKRIMMNPHLYHVFYFHIQTKVKYFYLHEPNKVAKTEGTIVQSLCLPSTDLTQNLFPGNIKISKILWQQITLGFLLLCCYGLLRFYFKWKSKHLSPSSSTSLSLPIFLPPSVQKRICRAKYRLEGGGKKVRGGESNVSGRGR